jgi:hypothetical protein
VVTQEATSRRDVVPKHADPAPHLTLATCLEQCAMLPLGLRVMLQAGKGESHVAIDSHMQATDGPEELGSRRRAIQARVEIPVQHAATGGITFMIEVVEQGGRTAKVFRG